MAKAKVYIEPLDDEDDEWAQRHGRLLQPEQTTSVLIARPGDRPEPRDESSWGASKPRGVR